jgi:hypothetical protein
MKVRDANRASAIRDTGDSALRDFRLGGDAMEMRRRKRLPEQQHDRRNDCDFAREIFIAMLESRVH